MFFARQKIFSLSYLILLLVTIVFYSCGLTRKNVIGKWQVSRDKILYVNPDNTFKLVQTAQSDSFRISALDTTKYVDGTWKIYGKVLSFRFNDTTQSFGGGCKAYQYMWTKGSRKSLMRPSTCKTPTNRFTSMNKIE